MSKAIKPRHITKKNWDAVNVPALSATQLRKMKPAREVLPDIVATHKKRRGRPLGRTKKVVSLSIDEEVLSALRASGRGWQTRVNDLLKAAVGFQERE